jgi:hydroxymethylpyrimidine pyrophosphatase-like HAD family hydrolase
LIDDHPNTGSTFKLLINLLVDLGTDPEAISVLAPRHAVKADWTLSSDTTVRLVVTEPWELHKARFLERCAEDPPFARHYRDEGWSQVTVVPDATSEAINRQLEDHFPDAWHVRSKRVFTVRLSGSGRPDSTRRVLGKSVGWGWLGYHAAIAAVRLNGWVPRPLALQDGVLFTEWVTPDDGTSNASNTPDAKTVGAYVATRAGQLDARDDPYIENNYEVYTGWQVLLETLRESYGSYITRRLKKAALRHIVRSFRSPRPTLVDGRMGLDEWVAGDNGLRKIDFEHHNFGRTELNIVDAAYDLASAAFELNFTEEQFGEMLDRYVEISDDHDIGRRLFPYQLICGLYALKRAPVNAVRARSRAKQGAWNLRYLKGRDFLTYTVHHRAAALIRDCRPARWGERLFFLDLDGVFDGNVFGFPTTTLSGLRALALLKSAGWTVLPCTGRSGDHVVEYCRAYGLAGGVAEHGALWIDAVEHQRHALVDACAQEQLDRCRASVAREWKDVLIDDAYRHSVCLYRFQNRDMQRLSDAEVEAFLARNNFDRLTHIHTSADTYLVAKGVEKISGVRAIREHCHTGSVPFAAIGDSGTDVSMLTAADFAFAPANCADTVRAAARHSGIRLMRQERQKGLLAAVRELTLKAGMPGTLRHGDIQPRDALTRVLLEVPDRSKVQQLASLPRRGP